MGALIIQSLIFALNILRDYLIAVENIYALNYLIISLAIMGFVSSGLLDVVMVRSLNFGSLQKYILIACSIALALLVYDGNVYTQYIFYLSCALLNIVVFSNASAYMSVLLKRGVVFFQTITIFSIIFFINWYQLVIPFLFYIASIFPFFVNLFLKRYNIVKFNSSKSLSSFDRWVVFKICLAILLSAFILNVASSDSSVEATLALRFLSYFVTGINIFIPMIMVGELFRNIHKTITYALFFIPVIAILFLSYNCASQTVLYISIFSGFYLIFYIFFSKKILIDKNLGK